MPGYRGINKVLLLGNIFSLPRAHCNASVREEYVFTLITNEPLGGKNGGTERPEYHDVRVPAQLMPANGGLRLGQMVRIEGKAQTMSSIDGQQIRRYKTHIIAIRIRIVKSLNIRTDQNTTVVNLKKLGHGICSILKV